MKTGILEKRTHSFFVKFITPWQHRFVMLKEGILSYYRVENETEYRHMGSLNFDLYKCQVIPHESPNK